MESKTSTQFVWELLSVYNNLSMIETSERLRYYFEKATGRKYSKLYMVIAMQYDMSYGGVEQWFKVKSGINKIPFVKLVEMCFDFNVDLYQLLTQEEVQEDDK